MAKAQEAPTKEAKVRKEIVDFNERYIEALAEARVSAEHTQTTGWQELYSLHRTTVDTRRKEMAEQLEEIARTMKRGGMSEDAEKELGELKKQSVELRADISAFNRKVIVPIQEPVMQCHHVIDQARQTARAAEAASPLTHRGLIADMDEAISLVQKVKFDDDTGVVVIA